MRVVTGMSGGVDSAVAALLLKRQGHDVVGVFMKNWEEKDPAGGCTAAEDWQDVQDCCALIGIPYYSVNFSREYRERVFSVFLDEYRSGRTPNPDVLCNREIKFRAFLDFAMQAGAEKIATGHFARTGADGRLFRGFDPNKDQSYFLYMLRSRQLSATLFPVGCMTKNAVRETAAAAGLPVHDKPDSTGICFIGERDFKRFLKGFLPAQPGLIRTDRGEAIGAHEGLMYYTIGQRKGIGIGGKGDGSPFYVVGKDLAANELIVSQGRGHPLLYSDGAVIEQLSWVLHAPCGAGERIGLSAKFRYRQPDQRVSFSLGEGGTALLQFQVPQRAVTPGQSAVLYQGDECLGGGIVRSVFRN